MTPSSSKPPFRPAPSSGGNSLFDTPLKNLFPLLSSRSAEQASALKKLGIVTVKDLLYHFPQRYGISSSRAFIEHLNAGDTATIFGKVKKLKTGKSFRGRMPMAEGVVEDSTGTVKVIWFHQPYIAKLIQSDSLVRVTGKVSERNGSIAFLNPEIESISSLPLAIGESLWQDDENKNTIGLPIYAESKGVTSQWIFHAVQKIFKTQEFNAADFDKVFDPIPAEILETYSLPSLRTALIWMHAPQKEDQATVARKRFAFEEVFFIQLKNEARRAEQQSKKGFIIDAKKIPGAGSIDDFIKKLGFPLTEGQKGSIDDILHDFTKGIPMSRLLEGDVGSGKTAVAAATTYAAITTRPRGVDFGSLQVAYMAPTEILARQHFESFIKYFRHLPLSIGLITGNGCRKFPSKVNPNGWTDISRAQFLKWVANGEIAVVIGTHALIQKSVAFKHLAYVIIDEQHRFGTAQRQKLARKSEVIPHLLSMTATPIPRTLALTIYGDLDLSILDQMPLGRKNVVTEIVSEAKREDMYEKIREEMRAGRQAYVICARIDAPDPDEVNTLTAKSVKEEAARLKKDIFKDARIEILHSKMKPADKEDVMERFSRHEIDILVSTSVVEVGVNVPNSSLIVIEGAERFGLAQLHQLRGRVIRGTHQPYCFLCVGNSGDKKTKNSAGKTVIKKTSISEKTAERLKALVTAKNGFELAELDLKMRGAGELYAGKQWGLSDIAMEAIKNIKMVEAARKEAKRMITEDPTLSKHPDLAEALAKQEDVHFE